MLHLPFFNIAQTNEPLPKCFVPIVEAIKVGSINDLAVHLAPSVECDILEQSNVYSKAQATQILKDFFVQNKPKSFSVLHKSGKDVKYIIGTYLTLTGKSFRISCFVRQVDEQSCTIQQIIIKEDTKTAEIKK